MQGAGKGDGTTDDRVRVAVIAGDADDRAAVTALLCSAGLEPIAAGDGTPGGAFLGENGHAVPGEADVVLAIPGRSPIEPSVAAARLRTLAGPRGVVLALDVAASPAASLPGALGPGSALLRWPASAREVARAVATAADSARSYRRLAETNAPATTGFAVERAVALAGSDGHPAWFLDALLEVLDGVASGGAVLVPRLSGPPRVLAAAGVTAAQVVRFVRRRPPRDEAEPVAERVRLERSLRSSSARLRAVRGWWWLPGPPCAGVGSRVLLVHDRAREEPLWAAAALDLMAERLAGMPAAPPFDPVTGLGRIDAATLASRCTDVGTGRAGGRGACVLHVSIGCAGTVRRQSGPRVEARVLATAARVLAARRRSRDLLFRAGVAGFALVVSSQDAGQAERVRRRLGETLAPVVVLARAADGVHGGVPLQATVRALFVPSGEASDRVIERLVRLGIPSAVDFEDNGA